MPHYKDNANNRKKGRVGKEYGKTKMVNKSKAPTHKMPNGDIHTGKTHTSSSKLVKKGKKM